MKNRVMKAAAAALMAAGLAVSLAACSGGGADGPIGGDVIAPVTMGVNDLQGATVDLVVGQVLNIDTESLAVDSYTGKVEDTKVARFTEGRDDGSAQFNPGVEALAVGTTGVVMTNEQGGIQPLEFTVKVSER